MTEQEQRINELELQVSKLQAEAVSLKNESHERATFMQCVERLHELGVSIAKVTRGLRAVEISKSYGPEAPVAFARLSYIDQHGKPPERGW